MAIESKKTTINTSAERVYAFVSDFNNFGKMLPPQVEGWQTDGEKCSFKVSGFMQITLAMTEKVPCSKVVVAPDTAGATPMQGKIVFDISSQDTQSVLKIVVDVDLPAMAMMMIKKKIQSAIDMVADQLKYFIENQQN